jgi:predicted phage-related endonuclease
MRNIDRIPEAIADLETQEVPNVSATAEKYDVTRKTLENRWKGKSVSMAEAVSIYRQCLTNSQEKALVRVINQLTERRMPPTTAIVKNLAEEIRGCAVRKNWTAAFVERHKHELKSLYLKSIDNKRVKGEYPPVYKYFYKLVKLFLCCF